MFTDVCFPKNNEEKFIEIAKKLSINSLLFIYEDKIRKFVDKDIKIFQISKKSKLIFTNKLNFHSKKKKVYYFDNFINKKNFHAPSKIITQVHTKEFDTFGFSFSYFLKKRDMELFKFLFVLLKKYNKNVFFASFAKFPYELRSESNLISFAKLIGCDSKIENLGFVFLSDYLEEYQTFL